jgi:hypothetical protein
VELLQAALQDKLSLFIKPVYPRQILATKHL